MTHTISGTYGEILTLSSALDNPTTITTSGFVVGGLQVSYTGLIVLNAGRLTGVPGAGISLLSGGSVTNQSDGTVMGVPGILGVNAAVSVVNAGYISTVFSMGNPNPATGIYLTAGGSVTNLSGGTISGRFGAITGRDVGVTLLNAGLISSNSEGVFLMAGGSISNEDGGTIQGGPQGFGAIEGSGVTVVNAGRIAGSLYNGIGLSGGSVTNQSSGSISGVRAIYGVGAALTVVNAGTIAGAASAYFAAAAVHFAAGYTNRQVVEPGAVFNGLVDGGNSIGANAISTMELAAGGSAGSLSGIGTQFVDFAQTAINPGASWTLTGANSFAAGTTLTNAGTLTAADGTLSSAGLVVNDGSIEIGPSTAVFATLTGTGSIFIGGTGTVDTAGSVSAGQTIGFTAANGFLGVNPGVFAGQIDGFSAGDTITLAGVSDVSSAGIVNGNTLAIQRSGHPTVDLTLDPIADHIGEKYAATAAGVITEVPCFLPGTLIRTDRGEVPVQNLTVGDRVLTLSGAIRPIIWIGTGQVIVRPGRRGAATPIIVRKGALANNVPHHDLHITKGHELFLDDVLIPVEFLVNHRSILWDDNQRTVSFYHVELATHDVLLANGAAAESYRDDDNRWLFRNANSGWDRTPKPPCAPVLTGGPIVDRIWRRLLDRSGPRPAMMLTSDPDLHLLVDDTRVEATARAADFYVFRLPPAPTVMRVISRAAAPQELGLTRDPRRLGVALRRIAVRQTTRFRVIEARDETLAEGFHAFERDNGLRWTDGDARLPSSLIGGFEGSVELVLHLGGSTHYPCFTPPTVTWTNAPRAA